MGLFLATLIPTLLYLALFWWLDKYEKEPWGLFLAAFFYGCVPAVIFSIIVELAVGGSERFAMSIVAPLVEECAKGLAVLLIFLLWRREFDGILDGILYGAVVGLGFAMVENFFYFLQAAEAGNVLSVILLRSFAFGLNHAFFTAFTGAALGLARGSRWKGAWMVYFPLGLAIATTFHAIHNSAVSSEACAGLGVAFLSDYVGVILIVVFALLTGRQERRWLREELGEEVTAGLLAPSDLESLLSLRRRVWARTWTWRNRGWTAFRLLGKYLNQATELAFRKHHLREEPGNTRLAQDVQNLRQKVGELRAALLGNAATK
jgi:RsiW-degrading membrane proteinase PrsW (M82 family)